MKLKVLYRSVRTPSISSVEEDPPRRFRIISQTSTNRERRVSRLNNRTMSVHSQTGPRQCPLCRTNEDLHAGNIFRSSLQDWECNACSHKWRG